jgi:hypothetical protein
MPTLTASAGHTPAWCWSSRGTRPCTPSCGPFVDRLEHVHTTLARLVEHAIRELGMMHVLVKLHPASRCRLKKLYYRRRRTINKTNLKKRYINVCKESVTKNNRAILCTLTSHDQRHTVKQNCNVINNITSNNNTYGLWRLAGNITSNNQSYLDMVSGLARNFASLFFPHRCT